MTRVSGADQVLLLLREQLQRMDRGRVRRTRTERAGAATPRPLERLHDLTAFDQLPDEERRRTLVRAVLTEELGEAVANDPSFQAVLDEVSRIIGESEEGRTLVERAARQLRGAGA